MMAVDGDGGDDGDRRSTPAGRSTWMVVMTVVMTVVMAVDVGGGDDGGDGGRRGW